MCGIAGVLDYSSSTTIDTLKSMLSKIYHRGPDDNGIFKQGPILLGHQRLSILDIENGHQPMTTSCGQNTVVFNGEIFNHIELREKLVRKGFVFRTRSDTEVVLNSYLAFGNSFMEELNGQWSLAIWDNKNEKLLISRDRLGIRPLHFFHENKFFAFASEAKSLFCHPRISPQIDAESLIDTLTFWCPLPGKSIFSKIYELRPGETKIIYKDRVENEKYWSFSFPSQKISDFTHATQSVKQSIVSATKLRLRSDVPVASYLSGGLDSFIISSIAVKDSPLTTFSISFPNTNADEYLYQKIASNRLQTEHHTIHFDSEKFRSYFKKAIWHIEKPILRAGPIPLIALSEFVKQNNFKVVLTGEGADEIFCGYDIFREIKARLFFKNHPRFYSDKIFAEKAYAYASGAPENNRINSHFFKTLRFDNEIISSHEGRWRNGRTFRNILSDDILSEFIDYDPVEEYLKCSTNQNNLNWLESAQSIEASLLLPGYILSSQSDRVGLANGVEARFPFLDHHVVELANSLPNHFKLARLNEKHILKEAFKDEIPTEILERPKRPYESPITEYIARNQFSDEYFNEIISDNSIRKFNLFSPKKVSALRNKISSSKKISHRDSTLLLAILSTQQLADLFHGKT